MHTSYTSSCVYNTEHSRYIYIFPHQRYIYIYIFPPQKTDLDMAGNIPPLNNEELAERSDYIIQKVKELQSQFLQMNPRHQGKKFYLKCPKVNSCYCFEENTIPKLPIDLCMAPGEFARLELIQPFMPEFKVFWKCINCGHEMYCGLWWL